MDFAAAFIALYVGHHIGDYWVQTDAQARTKGAAGNAGRAACLTHVGSYLLTQACCLALTAPFVPGPESAYDIRSWWAGPVALLFSGVTHYTADRREHGLMFWLARRLPGKAAFLKLGVPREDVRIEIWDACSACEGRGTSFDESTGGKCWDCKGGGSLPITIGDNPSLGTGAWALDQSWHIALGCFVPALIIAAA